MIHDGKEHPVTFVKRAEKEYAGYATAGIDPGQNFGN